MTTTIKKIAKKALQKSGVLTKTEEPDADEMQDAVDAINNMLSSWSNDSMLVYARSWETFTGLPSQMTYTIGPGQDFDTIRPIKIVACTVTVGQTDLPVTVINDGIYFNQISYKNVPGVPDYMNFDNGFPDAKLRFYPYPNTDYPINLLTEKELLQYGINDAVDLPPGWERALIFNGGIEVSSDYGQEPPAATVAIAKESKGLIRKAVNVARDLDAQPANGTADNIYSGYWNRK